MKLLAMSGRAYGGQKSDVGEGAPGLMLEYTFDEYPRNENK